MRGIFFPVLFNALVSALPQVAFPFNSQVPAVARVNEAYAFQLAATTFTSSDGSTLVYSLTGAPAWLDLESATRTLYGTPGQDNTGPNTFKITATGNDGAVNMDCTLVVASNSAPTLSGNISEDLARSGFLSGPTTLLLQPSTAFAITFSSDLFGDPGSIKAYYATMSDRTPLPSWLKFDSSSLTLWGMTPVLATGSQNYGVDLIASDVAGFAGTATTFSLLISNNQLAFNPQTENITIAAERSISLGSFKDQLYINGKQISDSQIQHATAKLPPWLALDNSTLELTGTPPRGFKSQRVTISVTDVYGDTAVKNIVLSTNTASLFTEEIGNLTATAGIPFSYTISSSVLTHPDVDISIDVGTTSSWLNFDQSKRQLHGTPPSTTKASANTITLTASSDSVSETQTFFINLKASAMMGGPSTSQSTTQATSSPTSTSSPSASAAGPKDKDMRVGIVIGIVIGCLAILALFFAIAMLCCRRRRKQPRKKIEKADIKPILPYGDQEPMMTESHHHDEEKYIGSPVKRLPEEPPQIDVDLPTPMQPPMKPRYFLGGRGARHSKLSVVSSLGDGEAAIQADSNIPVWGRESGTTHTPHHSYSAATELARQNSQASRQRLSDFRRLSPSKRASRLIRSWHPGLAIVSHGSVIHRPKRKSRLSSTFSISRDRDSQVSLRTHGTSILSTKTSEYHRSSSNRNSRSIPGLGDSDKRRSLTEAEKRRSIRIVSQAESVVDPRPLAEKRQSFIRNRASSSIMSPLFASSRRSSNLGLYSNIGSIKGRSPSIRRQITPSPLLEPPARNPRRLITGAQTFAPSFPRAISPSPVRNTNNNSPTLPPANTADNWTTTNTSSSLSRDNSDARAAAQYAEYAVQMELPRHQRTWVRPGEASPTPPPSSILRNNSESREAARRKWASRLNRNSSGNLTSRSPSPQRITLRGVSAHGIRGRKERLKGPHDEDKENMGQDRLSKLVSNDSFSGVRAMRGRKSLVQVETGPRISSSRARVEDVGDKGKSGDEGEWEDVVGERSPRKSVPAGVLAPSTSNASSVRFL